MGKVGGERWLRGIFNFWYKRAHFESFRTSKVCVYFTYIYIFYASHPFESSVFPVLSPRKFSWNVYCSTGHEAAWSARSANFTVDHIILVHSHNMKLKCAILAFKSLSIILPSEDFFYGCRTRSPLEIRSLLDIR